MIELFRAALELQTVCESEHWRYCFIGGLALLRWGEARETVDVDLTLMTGFGGEAPFIHRLLKTFPGRIDDAAAFAVENRVLLLKSSAGVGIDVALGALAFEETAIERASMFSLTSDATLRTCSAEDLIVMKAFANRGRDWADIEGILTRQADALDWKYIWRQLRPLAELKGAPQIVAELERRRSPLE